MRQALPRLTLEERARILAALHYLHARVGTWRMLARVLRTKRATLRRVRAGATLRKQRSLAGRIAKLCDVPVADIYAGRFPPQGACPHCGRGGN